MTGDERELGELRAKAERSSEDRRDIWKAIQAQRETASSILASTARILEKLDSFERRAADRHDRLDRENAARDLALGDYSRRLALIETEKRTLTHVFATLWSGAGALALWAAQHFFGLGKP